MCYSLYEYFNTNVWCYSPKDFYEDSNFMIIPFNEFIKNDISCYSKLSFAVRDRAKVIGNTISDHKYPIGSIVTIDYVSDVNENTEHYKVHNTKDKNKHQFIGLVDLAPIDDYESMSYFKLVDYLNDTFYTTDFVNDHTRKELACILRRIKPHEVKQSKNAFNSMCKQRMSYHIEFFIKTHLVQRRKSKGISEILDN